MKPTHQQDNARVQFMVFQDQKIFTNEVPMETSNGGSSAKTNGSKCKEKPISLNGRVVHGYMPVPSEMVQDIDANMNVTLKFKPSAYRNPGLHSEYTAGFWTFEDWSKMGCSYSEKDGYGNRVYKCNHLTDFTLLVDTVDSDPSLMD
jgi:hypothetical protein